MKTCLAMMVRDEMEMLPKTLPFLTQGFDQRIAIDTGSTDGTDATLRSLGFYVEHADWNSDFSAARNLLLDTCEKKGFDWCVMLDADEAMWREDALALQDSLEFRKAPVIYLPRYNICGDFDRWWNKKDRDLQGRVIRLGCGVHFANKVHEIPTVNGSGVPAITDGHGEIAGFHIYHYGLCKPPSSIWKRSLNYIALGKGEREPDEIPPAPNSNFKHLPKFKRHHPLHA